MARDGIRMQWKSSVGGHASSSSVSCNAPMHCIRYGLPSASHLNSNGLVAVHVCSCVVSRSVATQQGCTRSTSQWNIPQSLPSVYELLRSISANSQAVDAYDPAPGFTRNGPAGLRNDDKPPLDCFAEEKLSSNDKSSGSSAKSVQARPSRWKPNPHQLELLEQYFNTGSRRATPELHAAVQGCGCATEHNVNVWLKNRASRHKKSPSEKQKDSRLFHDADSDDDHCWGDFKAVSQEVLHELNVTVSGVSEGDALILARAIQDARNVLCYGIGKQALVMKGLASGLHHLGYKSFFMDDTNAPSFNENTLVLVGAGPGSGNRISGMIEDVLAARSRVIAFAPYKLSEAQNLYTIQIPTRHRLSIGQDGEVMSPMSEQDSWMSASVFDLSLTMLCECVCVMLREASAITPAEIRARHTNLE